MSQRYDDKVNVPSTAANQGNWNPANVTASAQQPSESLSAATRQELADRITQYLCVGGFFNPEAMEHDKVRTLLMDCRDALAAAPAGEQIEGLVKALKAAEAAQVKLNFIVNTLHDYWNAANAGKDFDWIEHLRTLALEEAAQIVDKEPLGYRTAVEHAKLENYADRVSAKIRALAANPSVPPSEDK